jgi:hypothetical protein
MLSQEFEFNSVGQLGGCSDKKQAQAVFVSPRGCHVRIFDWVLCYQCREFMLLVGQTWHF